MALDKNILKKIKDIKFSKYEPTSEFTLWAKPEADNKYGFYVFNNGSWQLLTTGEGGGSGEGDTIIINIPDVSGNISTFTNDSGYITLNDVPNELKDLSEDSTHRLVTDTEKSTWNGKQDAINDLDSIRTNAALGATALQAETDPNVPSWAKQPNKPSYTASEVGAVPTTRKVNNKALSDDITLSASDVGALPSSTVIPTVPSKVSAFTNDAGYTTNTGTVTSTGGTITVNNIQVVSALPPSTDANTLYLIPE